MKMTVSDLIEMLGDFDGDCEVRIAYQPSYPMELRLNGELVESEDDEDTGRPQNRRNDDKIVYLGTNESNGYLAEGIAEKVFHGGF